MYCTRAFFPESVLFLSLEDLRNIFIIREMPQLLTADTVWSILLNWQLNDLLHALWQVCGFLRTCSCAPRAYQALLIISIPINALWAAGSCRGPHSDLNRSWACGTLTDGDPHGKRGNCFPSLGPRQHCVGIRGLQPKSCWRGHCYELMRPCEQHHMNIFRLEMSFCQFHS